MHEEEPTHCAASHATRTELITAHINNHPKFMLHTCTAINMMCSALVPNSALKWNSQKERLKKCSCKDCTSKYVKQRVQEVGIYAEEIVLPVCVMLWIGGIVNSGTTHLTVLHFRMHKK